MQAYYLQAPFAVERAPTEPIPGAVVPDGVRVSRLSQYPVRGLCWEAGPGPEGLHSLAAAVAACCKRLQEANIPHNMFVVDSGHRLFMYPNAYAAAKASGKVPEALLDTQVTAFLGTGVAAGGRVAGPDVTKNRGVGPRGN